MTTVHPTLPERFVQAGYRTFGTGKWHKGAETTDLTDDTDYGDEMEQVCDLLNDYRS